MATGQSRAEVLEGASLAPRRGGGGGGCLRLDREEEPDHADQRDNRRGSDDRPGLAANEVAPLVEEGVDAVLDSLTERARARHPRAGLSAHLRNCLLSLVLSTHTSRPSPGFSCRFQLCAFSERYSYQDLHITAPAVTPFGKTRHVLSPHVCGSPGIVSTYLTSHSSHRPHT